MSLAVVMPAHIFARFEDIRSVLRRFSRTGFLRPYFLVSALLLAGGEGVAQESTNPAANPLDPAALNAPPAFGDSGPVRPTPILKSNQGSELGDEVTAGVWKPKFRFLLTTQTAEPGLTSAPLESVGEVVPVDSPPTADPDPSSDESSQQIVLLCDEVNVNASMSDDGTAVYRFTCRQRATLRIERATITGDSVSSDGATITVRNAVMSLNNQMTLKSDAMKLSVRVTGVQIQPESTERPPREESLRPIPDSIGRGPDGELLPDEEGSETEHGSEKLEPQ